MQRVIKIVPDALAQVDRPVRLGFGPQPRMALQRVTEKTSVIYPCRLAAPALKACEARSSRALSSCSFRGLEGAEPFAFGPGAVGQWHTGCGAARFDVERATHGGTGEEDHFRAGFVVLSPPVVTGFRWDGFRPGHESF
jgi:hypothetical protein